MDNLMVFEGNNVEVILGENNEPLFEIYSTGMALGQSKQNSAGKLYPRKDRIDENVKNADIQPCVHNGHKYLTEPMLYDLMLEMKTEKVKSFRKWVTNDVLPQIRQTGGYIPANNEDDEASIMAKALMIAQRTIENKDKLLKKTTEDLESKSKFINQIAARETSKGVFTYKTTYVTGKGQTYIIKRLIEEAS